MTHNIKPYLDAIMNMVNECKIEMGLTEEPKEVCKKCNGTGIQAYTGTIPGLKMPCLSCDAPIQEECKHSWGFYPGSKVCGKCKATESIPLKPNWSEVEIHYCQKCYWGMEPHWKFCPLDGTPRPKIKTKEENLTEWFMKEFDMGDIAALRCARNQIEWMEKNK